MLLNGVERTLAAQLYDYLGDAAGACEYLFHLQNQNGADTRSFFTRLTPGDAVRFVQLVEHLEGRAGGRGKLSLGDFVDLLAQKPESLREFLTLPEEEKTRRFESLAERFHSRDVDMKSSLENLNRGHPPPDDPTGSEH